MTIHLIRLLANGIFLQFVGVFEKQVYLNPSAMLLKNLSSLSFKYRHGTSVFTAAPTVRWAPYITSSKLD